MSAVNWDRIAERLAVEMAKMTHHEDTKLYGTAFYAEALRRALGHQEDAENGRDRLQRGEGLTVDVTAKYVYEGSAVVDRLNLESAQKQVEEARAEARRVYRDAGKDLAAVIRERCNERTVPSRFRREGVAWAADLIDPTVPKDRFGNLIPARAHAGLGIECTPCAGPCRADGEVAA